MWMGALIVAVAPVGAQEPAPMPTRLTAVLVQYRVESSDFASVRTFERRVSELVERAWAEHNADLVVFPEYLSVFALLHAAIEPDGTLRSDLLPADALRFAMRAADDPNGVPTGAERSPQRPPAAREITRFLERITREEQARILEVWADVAERYEVWLVAGSGFAVGPEGGVRNRAWVFGPDGRLVHTHDKAFPTPYERWVLGLAPGRVSAAETFQIAGIEFALTICRDSYFEAWEKPYRGADVWIDVRANGELWTSEVQRRFDGALPERVAATPVELGLSTSLNGRFGAMMWQGPAFVVDAQGRRVRQSPEVDATRLMPVEISVR
jgi:predicted amidohydrolase